MLGSTSVQVCTAVMHWGFRIVEDMIDGLSNWMDEKGFKSVHELVGKSVRRISSFGEFDLGFQTVANIDHTKCIQCNLCYIACNDSAHQCIDLKDLKVTGVANERLWPVVRVDDDATNASLHAALDEAKDERAPEEGDRGLASVLGEGPEARP